MTKVEPELIPEPETKRRWSKWHTAELVLGLALFVVEGYILKHYRVASNGNARWASWIVLALAISVTACSFTPRRRQ